MATSNWVTTLGCLKSQDCKCTGSLVGVLSGAAGSSSLV